MRFVRGLATVFALVVGLASAADAQTPAPADHPPAARPERGQARERPVAEKSVGAAHGQPR